MKYSIVQLSHPGMEYPKLNKKGILTYSKPGIDWSNDKKSGTRSWNNCKEHKRKFIRMNGVKYLDARKSPNKGEVTFWGEWEAQSSFDVISETDKDLDKPRLCHKPFFDSSCFGDMKHGTDPFIFGDHFWFTHCKQSYKSIRNLGEDSIVIFGSERKQDKMFLVDTIFVIGRRFSQKEIRENIEEYDDLLRKNNLEVKDLVRDQYKSEYGFYQGKSYKKNEIFSFVPARVLNQESIGHGRLELDTTNEIHNFQRPGAGSVCKTTKEFHNKKDLKKYWDLLIDETLNSGFVLAYDFPMPEIRKSNEHG